MSEYCLINTVYTEGEAIKASLKELGYTFEEHVEAQHLYGYAGDQRSQKAHIIIRRHNVGTAANDVGFLKRADGTYELIISEFDLGTGQKQGRDFTQKIKQIYAKHSILLKAKHEVGMTFCSQSNTADNEIQIRCTYSGF